MRDKEKREVDFLIVADRKPRILVECKLSDEAVSPHLLYYQEKLDVPLAVQLVREKSVEKEWHRGKRTQRVVSADRWLAGLL